MKYDRRTFTQASTASLLGVSLGCDGEPDGTIVNNSTTEDKLDMLYGSGGSGTDPGEGGSTGAEGGAGGSRGLTCGELTASDIEGPYFLENSPERANLAGGLTGVPLVLRGRVMDENCVPLEGALVDFWQADDAGVYDESGPTLRGHQFTDAEGNYELTTIVPGRYLNGATYRPAHLHLKVTAGGVTLTTQLYFPGDPFNDSDAWYRDELLIDKEVDGNEGEFDIVLPESPSR